MSENELINIPRHFVFDRWHFDALHRHQEYGSLAYSEQHDLINKINQIFSNDLRAVKSGFSHRGRGDEFYIMFHATAHGVETLFNWDERFQDERRHRLNDIITSQLCFGRHEHQNHRDETFLVPYVCWNFEFIRDDKMKKELIEVLSKTVNPNTSIHQCPKIIR